MVHKKWYRRFLIGLIFLVVFAAVHLSGIRRYLTLEMLKVKSDLLREYVHASYARAVLGYIALYIVVVACSLPAAAMLTVAGGYLFGTIPGVLYANVGATIGAIIAFFAVRYAIGRFIQQRYAVQLVQFNEEFKKRGALYLLSVHLVAIIPFVLINILAGLTKVSLWTFVWTTSVGILPGSLIFSFAGQQLHELSSLREIVTLRVFIAFLLIALLALTPTIFKRLMKFIKK